MDIEERATNIKHRLMTCISIITIAGTIAWIYLLVQPPGIKGSKLFNWHPIIMTTTILLPFRIGILSSSKREHGALMLLSFILFNIAILIAYTSHQQLHYPNFYSLHSWLGMLTIIMMKCNLITGFIRVIWNFPTAEKLVSHTQIGFVICIFAFLTAVLGFSQFQMFIVRDKSAWSFAAISANPLALGVVVVGFSSIYELLIPISSHRVNNDEANGKMGKAESMAEIEDVVHDTRELSCGSSGGDENVF